MELEIRLRVDGRQHRLVVDTRTTLADERQPVPLRRPRQHRPGDRGAGGTNLLDLVEEGR